MGTRTHRNISWEQFVAALEDDGYAQNIGTLFDPEDGSACAVGQAALNLGLNENDLSHRLNDTVRGFIFNQNDGRHRTPQQIAADIRQFPEGKRFQTIRVERKDWAATFPGYRGVTVPLGAVAARS